MYFQPRLSASYYHRRKEDVGEEEKEVVAEFFHSLAQADRCHRLRVATNRPTDHRVFSLSPLSFFQSLSLFLSFSSLRAHAPVFLFMKSRRRREKEKMREREREMPKIVVKLLFPRPVSWLLSSRSRVTDISSLSLFLGVCARFEKFHSP